MKVSSEISRITNVYNQNNKVAKQVDSKKNKGDRIDISTTGREISKYIEIASKTEVNNPKVDELKRIISEKNYKVDSEKLAKSIMDFIEGRDV